MDGISIQEPYLHLWLFIKKLTPSNSAVAAVSTEPLAADSEAGRVDTRPKYHTMVIVSKYHGAWTHANTGCGTNSYLKES